MPLINPIRSQLHKDIIDIVPEFHMFGNKEKFKFIMTSNDHDINKVCLNGIAKICKSRLDLSNNNPLQHDCYTCIMCHKIKHFAKWIPYHIVYINLFCVCQLITLFCFLVDCSNTITIPYCLYHFVLFVCFQLL